MSCCHNTSVPRIGSLKLDNYYKNRNDEQEALLGMETVSHQFKIYQKDVGIVTWSRIVQLNLIINAVNSLWPSERGVFELYSCGINNSYQHDKRKNLSLWPILWGTLARHSCLKSRANFGKVFNEGIQWVIHFYRISKFFTG